jgi:hypothetical protein
MAAVVVPVAIEQVFSVKTRAAAHLLKLRST